MVMAILEDLKKIKVSQTLLTWDSKELVERMFRFDFVNFSY